MKEINLKVKGIRCSGCEKAIINIFRSVEGIFKIEPSAKSGKLFLAYDENKIDIDKIKRILLDIGKEVVDEDT